MSLTKHQLRNLDAASTTVTLNGTTAVTVTPTVPLTANSEIILTLKTAAGTQTGHPYVFGTPTVGQPGTASFQVKATGAADTSIYNVSIKG